MNRRMKLKIRNIRLFFTKNVFNSRYIVRNILALTIIVTLVAMSVGAGIVICNRNVKADDDAGVLGSVKEVVTLDDSIVSMNAAGTNVLRADLESSMMTDKEAKEKEVVASARSEFADKCVANQDDVNVRKEASVASEIVGHMNIGACGTMIAQADGWVQLTSGEVEGYVRAEYLTLGEEAYALAQRYYSITATVKEDGVNLRAEANQQAEAVGAVYENVTYTVIPEKTDDEWVCIQVSVGTEGYVSAEYMKVMEGYRVAEPVEAAAVNDTTSDDASAIEAKRSSGSIEGEKQLAHETAEKLSTTQQATTEATTQTSTGSDIGSSSRTPVSLSDADINLMAAVMTLECGNESYEGQLAVANVILNRLQSGAWGSTISDVVYAANQFSVVSDSRLQGLIQNGAQASCIQAARDACAGNNNIGNLMSFRPARYVDTSTLGTYKQIGNHVFFK